jgi:GAF domain-containing protein
MTTGAILCAPLRTRAGNIGVLEVINPVGGRFDAGDLAFLEALAADVAVACEKARLYDRLRGETLALRQICRVAGLGLAAVGLVFAAGAVYAHLARALPLRELAARPAMQTGALLVAAGITLARVARGWLVRATPTPWL